MGDTHRAAGRHPGMELLLVLMVIAVVAVFACALGSVTGPATFTLGFAGLGALFVLGASGQGFFVMVGLAFWAAAAVEAAATKAYWELRAAPGGPTGAWRWTAGLVGFGGSAGFLVLIILVAMAIAGFYSQL